MIKVVEQTQKHPCYSEGAHHKYARMHLPVAPACNISCNYCNRKFDCMNESRPGVTSEVLTPAQATIKFQKVKQAIPQLSVVGIAGPGDALANWAATKATLEALKKEQEDIIYCLSTNGLMLPEYADELVDLGVNHITITINTLDPKIGAKLYKHVTYKGIRYTGESAASLLMAQQLLGLSKLVESGVKVKVNIVMIKGLNELDIPNVVKKVKELGAFMTNIMPLIPAPGSEFQDFSQTSMVDVVNMRKLCELDLTQMHHCKQCRADAIGMLGDDRSLEFKNCHLDKTGQPSACNTASLDSKQKSGEEQYYTIAVASKNQIAIDTHFGHADKFLIYKADSQSLDLVEIRETAKYCVGNEACDEDKRQQVIEMLSDCDAVISQRIGHSALARLQANGIKSYQHYETIPNSIQDVVQKLAKKKFDKGVINYGKTEQTHICL